MLAILSILVMALISIITFFIQYKDDVSKKLNKWGYILLFLIVAFGVLEYIKYKELADTESENRDLAQEVNTMSTNVSSLSQTVESYKQILIPMKDKLDGVIVERDSINNIVVDIKRALFSKWEAKFLKDNSFPTGYKVMLLINNFGGRAAYELKGKYCTMVDLKPETFHYSNIQLNKGAVFPPGKSLKLERKCEYEYENISKDPQLCLLIQFTYKDILTNEVFKYENMFKSENDKNGKRRTNLVFASEDETKKFKENIKTLGYKLAF